VQRVQAKSTILTRIDNFLTEDDEVAGNHTISLGMPVALMVKIPATGDITLSTHKETEFLSGNPYPAFAKQQWVRNMLSTAKLSIFAISQKGLNPGFIKDGTPILYVTSTQSVLNVASLVWTPLN